MLIKVLYYSIFLLGVLAFIASLTIFFFPSEKRYLRYFSIFLFINCLFELGTNFMAYSHINNILFSNLTTVIAFTFYFYMLREIVHGKTAKKVLRALLFGYPAAALVNISFIQRDTFHTMTYSLGCLLIVAFCIYYFWELFQQSHSITLSREPAFWICSGLLFYYACTFPIYGLTNLLERLPKVIIKNLLLIFDLLNIFLYLSFTIAFLCRVKPRKSMSSF